MQQADVALVCIATTMDDVNSIEPHSLRGRPARSVSSGAMDAVARTSETIHSSQRGPTRRADEPPKGWSSLSKLPHIREIG